jgi:diacylglycerol kinase (ATP)
MDVCVIFNPQAGSADEVTGFEAAISRLGNIDLYKTRHPGHAKILAQQALDQGHKFFVAAGGDGTINEVVNGLAGRFDQVRLGIIPVGTGNDLVRSINIPDDISAAIDVLLAGNVRAVDVVRVCSDKERYFLNVSSGGFSGLVDEKLTDEMKRAWGPLAYLRSAVEALPELTSHRTTLAFDEEERVELDVYNIVIANARYVAGGIPIAPRAEPDDGLVDVIVVPMIPMSQLMTLVPQILLGQHLDNNQILYRRARMLNVSSQPGMWFNVDGELVGNEPSTFEVIPRALQVVVGTKNEVE